MTKKNRQARLKSPVTKPEQRSAIADRCIVMSTWRLPRRVTDALQLAADAILDLEVEADELRAELDTRCGGSYDQG